MEHKICQFADENTNLPLYTNQNMALSPNEVKILGIHNTHKKQDLIERNFNPAVAKLDNIIRIWRRRDLTLYGKVDIIKAHLQSQLVYQLSVVPSPSAPFLKRMQKLLLKYLWNDKPDKIKRSRREEGGLVMPNIEQQNMSLKITWIQRLLQNKDYGWATCALNFFPEKDVTILKGNISPKDLQHQNLVPSNHL
jgi:hypothetical protein